MPSYLCGIPEHQVETYEVAREEIHEMARQAGFIAAPLDQFVENVVRVYKTDPLGHAGVPIQQERDMR
jgi:hypothetical protein